MLNRHGRAGSMQRETLPSLEGGSPHWIVRLGLTKDCPGVWYQKPLYSCRFVCIVPLNSF
eukprot:COSAG01_NODE_13583_length_1564_cov_1.808191_1_plen_59_part_10